MKHCLVDCFRFGERGRADAGAEGEGGRRQRSHQRLVRSVHSVLHASYPTSDLSTKSLVLFSRAELTIALLCVERHDDVVLTAGKHPVSALMELTKKRRWMPPIFEIAFEDGPPHKKNFLFKVKLKVCCC